MNFLFENPVPIYAVSGVFLTLAGLIFFNRRDLPSLIALVTTVLFALSLVLLERMVVTDREQVELTVGRIMESIQANDVPGVLADVDPAATKVRSDIQVMMPEVRVEDTGYASLEVDEIVPAEPLRVSSTFRGKLDGVHKTSGHRLFYFDVVRLDWVKRDEKWLLEDYQPMWKGKPINAVGSMRGNQVVPAR